ncbi:hypothetical protein [Rhizobium sp. CECT 9324]|jgi:hypothetical protein|uniref:hypothetical protein n=1 Tax=Rhizobium sp. CECT 9324 TaxID=2845820 RepID=UPI001E2D259C|nr:hypothetical protein [Rhizobium sp. CECT 9324]
MQLNAGDRKSALNSGNPHVAMQQLQVSRAIAHLTEPAERIYIWPIERRGDRVLPERNREMAKSFLRIALDNFVEARQRRANLYANGALQTLDDQTLSAMGLNREELRRKPSLRSIS